MMDQLTSFPQDKTIVDIFLEQVSKTPNNSAIEFEGVILTYHELNEQSNQLAHYLKSLGVKEEDLIPICLHRSINMIIGVLGILKAGAAYVPIDPDYPIERIEYIIKDTKGPVVITEQNTPLCFETDQVVTILIDRDQDKIKQQSTTLPINNISPSNLAYVIYTSGSTGKPKGVLIEHRNVVRLFKTDTPLYDFNDSDVWVMFHSFCFDVSVWEMYGALFHGGKLIIIPKYLTKDSASLVKLLIDKKVTILNQTPSAFYVLQDYILKRAETHAIRYVIFAGESLNPTKLKQWKQTYPTCKTINMYGITETTVHVTYQEIELIHCDSSKSIIGKPIPTLYTYVLNENKEHVDIDQEGELYVGGAGIGRGYQNLPELTAERFIKDPFNKDSNARLYRSGDLAKRNINDTLEYLGRIDDQVKIRGYRIELGEIENVLQRNSAVKQAVVLAKVDKSGEKRLVAYIVPRGAYNKADVLNYLESKLPDYMVPRLLMELTEVPLTSNGKVDKKSLPNPDATELIDTVYVAPKNSLEKTIVNIWRDLLHLNKIGVNDNFFELGGNSLLAQNTVTILLTKGVSLPITKLYQYPTILGISSFLEGGEKIQEKRTINRDRHNGNDIAVIAMAGRFPGASSIEELWENLKEGKESIQFFSEDDIDPSIPNSLKKDPNYVKARGIIDGAEDFDPNFFGINPKLAEIMDPQQRKFLEICWEALETAGYSASTKDETVGIYAGSSSNTYFINNIHPNKELIDLVGNFNVLTLSDKDFLATRVAYALNLKGPAMTVQSACSTSLLAIAEAVESIRSGQCELALAGGVAINAPIKSGHLYEEGAILSKDGHCRSFDENAQGTVFSDGAAVVLLKDRKKAELDGDCIYAIIKGIGISNDGGFKGSFTAPSAEGQATCINKAFDDAEIDPPSISYVETHGTATPIGDPIEIEGLNIAFGNKDRKQYCAIGSIKSNMGHLTQAAGAAGFIKTCLSLYHKQIPASINFTRPNPSLALEDSPFYVNDKLINWPVVDKKRAGVSSFGVGGTNVHIILEEYPTAKNESSEGRPFELITWSAKSEKSREDYAIKLEKCLKAQSDIKLADIAYTLQTNKTDFNHRRFIIAANKSDLISKLSLPAVSVGAKILKEKYQELAFVFPGQGAQYIDMGKELYQNEPIFKEAIDTCAELLKAEINEDIRKIMYPTIKSSKSEERLNDTYYTQPALFITEYALAKLWMSLGIQPTIFIGHSIGEFVAAHLAGIFSLEDALYLITTRAKLMASLPKGSMLAVRESHEIIHSILPKELSISTINSPNLCVVAGPIDSVEIFSEQLKKTGVLSKLLHTSHAFHSSMMDPIVAPFEQIVESIKLNVPKTPIISTVTGKWIKDAEATDPAYWAKHLRSTVRFSDAIKTLIEKDDSVLILEVGPKNSSTMLIRQQATNKPILAIPSLDYSPDQNEYYSFLKAIGQLWLNGISINWDIFYSNQKRIKLNNLPTYAFDKRTCWINPLPVTDQSCVTNDSLIQHTLTHQQAGESNSEKSVPVDTAMRKIDLIKKVKKIFENTSGIETDGVNPDSSFIEIGLDSLLLTQVALTLKKEFQLPITFRKLSEEYGSLSLLAEYLDANLPQEIQPNPIQASHLNDNHFHNGTAGTLNHNSNYSGSPEIKLISQQIQLLAQQISLLQNNSSTQAHPVLTNGNYNTQIPEKTIELTKPFAATAKTERYSKELSLKQKEYLNNLIARYNEKTKKSKEYTQKHRACMADPRVASGFKPHIKEMIYPLVMNKSKGSTLWDIDGNEYIDMINGFGSNLLGYQPDFLKQALIEQIEKGYEIGPQHILAGEVSQLICEFSKQDRATLCNNGSEAVLIAMRIARTVTGKSLIVIFNGSNHGNLDEALVRGNKNLKSFPISPGIMQEAVQNILLLDYGTEESLNLIKERSGEIAAVLIEPVQSTNPEFHPIQFLKDLRSFTSKSEIVFIFDEVITGFRMHPGGIQALYDIEADLVTYGKAIGGGMPIGAIAGKNKYMDALDGGYWEYGDHSFPQIGVTYFRSTFLRHPLALASTKAILLYMKEKGPQLQEDLNQKTHEFVNGLQDICDRYNLPFYVIRFGSLWRIKYKQEYAYSELLFTLMREKGVYILDGLAYFVVESHTQEELELVVQKFEESIIELLYHEFIPTDLIPKSLYQKETSYLSNTPPIKGALLGKDEEGNPAWFLPDDNLPGRYLQVNF